MTKHQAKNLVLKTGRWFAGTSLPEIIFISTFIVQRWYINSDISYPSDIVPLLIIFAILATAIFYGYRFILKRNLAARISSLLLIYFGMYLYTFAIDHRFVKFFINALPDSWATPFTSSIVVFLVMALVAGLLGFAVNWLVERYKTLQYFQLGRVVMFAILFTASVVGVRAGIRFLTIHNQLSYIYPTSKLPQKPSSQPTSKPNIYFLMYEDYTDADTLKRVNNFDNTPFFDKLAENGFVTRKHQAYSSYPFTTSSLASVFAMNYFPDLGQQFGNKSDWQTTFPYRSIINNPPAVQVLKQNGYTYNQVGSWWENSRIKIKADNQPTKSYRLDVFGLHIYFGDLSREIVNKSILSPWLKKGITIGHTTLIQYNRDLNPQQNLDDQTDAIKAIADKGSTGQPQFTFGHVMVPHTPYIFLPDGSEANYGEEHDDYGAPETEKYANQVAFINKHIDSLTSYIRQHDPSAVIILQSDEGSYPPQFRYVQTPDHYFDPINLSPNDMRQKFGILASYYTPGVDDKTVQTELAAAVNIFPFVLNHYLGYNMPLLPNCQFATGNKFGLYNYKLVTQTLFDQPTPAACNKL